MKNISLILLTLVLPSIFLQSVFADTIIDNGTAQDNINVTTNTQGSGSVHTHIESTVNGNTQVLDSNKPGTYTLNNSSNSSTSSQSSTDQSGVTSTPTGTNTPTPTITLKHLQPKVQHHILFSTAVINTLQKLFHDAIQKLSTFFTGKNHS